MSRFIDFYRKAVDNINADQSRYKKRNANLLYCPKVRCRFCLAEANLHRASGTVLCWKCGNSFSMSAEHKYSIDLASVDQMSGKQLFDAAFYDGKTILPFLELSAKKGHLEALLFLAKYWENNGDQNKAEAYYQTMSEQSAEGKAAYILYRFRQEPPVSQYADLLIELYKCRQQPFYVVDPNECLDVYDAREKLYIQYCKDEHVRRIQIQNEQLERRYQEQYVEKDEYIDDDFYNKYYLPYINGQTADDGADAKGMAWVADYSNADGM